MRYKTSMQKSFEKDVESLVSSIDGTVGVHCNHLEKGLIFALNDQVRFPLASTYKIPIAIQCLKRVDEGAVDLETRIDLKSEDIVESSAILDHRHFSYPGIELSVRNLIRLMLEYSDNSASDIILNLAGGPTAVNQFLRQMGFSDISVDRSTAQVFREQNSYKSKDKSFFSCGRDSGTPMEMAKLLKEVLESKILKKETAEFLLDCMKRCKTGTKRIRALLPNEIVVADKTGTAEGFVNDIAVIELPEDRGKLILAVYIQETTASLQQAELLIANIAKVIFDYVTIPTALD